MLRLALTLPTVRPSRPVAMMESAEKIVFTARTITNVVQTRYAAMATVLIHVFGRLEALQAL